MNTNLVISDHRGTKTTLVEFPVVFGRDQTADVLLTNVLTSRRHCEIAKTDGELVLRDLESVNGTTLNGAPIDEQVLHAGDQFAIGTSVFDVISIGEAHAIPSSRRGVLGGVAQMLRSIGRERPPSDVQLAPAASHGVPEQFN